MQKKFSFLLIILLLSGVLLLAKTIKASSEDNVSGWAWTENIGLISFNNTTGGGSIDYGVNIDSLTGIFSGYAWSENIGLISFNTGELTGCPSGTCEAGVNFGTWEISGWARACAVFQSNCSGFLRPDTERGGWEGWIKLRGIDRDGNPYGAWINNNVIPNEFRGWAWGGDSEGNPIYLCPSLGGAACPNLIYACNHSCADRSGEAVIGWVSFNHLNCDPDNDWLSEGLGSCPPAGTSIPDYKVIYAPTDKPSVVSLGFGASEFCSEAISKPAGQGIITLKWTYQDDDNESRFDLKINDFNNVNDPNPEVNLRECGIAPSTPPSPRQNDQIVLVVLSSASESHTYCPGTPNEYTVTTPDALTYGNKTYYWWVKVWDSEGYDSGWVAGPSFSTPRHASPYPNFNPFPSNPKVSQVVEFTDISQCWDNGNAGYNCNTPPAEINPLYQWNFDFKKDDVEEVPIDIDSTDRGTTNYPYTEEGTYTAKLEITDNVDTCPTERNIIVKPLIPPPKWKEIPPTSWFIKKNFSFHSIQKIFANISNFSVSFFKLD